MERKPLIFISYCQKHHKVKDFFQAILMDMGFQTEVFDYGASKNPPEMEKELIERCDGLIGILTPDVKIEQGSFQYSHSVNSEISFAFASNKFIQLFALNDVDLGVGPFIHTGTISKLYTSQALEGESDLTFNDKNIRQIIKTLIEFKRNIENIHKLKQSNVPTTFSYKKIEIRQTILSKEVLQIDNRFESISLKNIESHTHAGRLLCDIGRGNGIKLDLDKLRFKLILPLNTEANIRIGENGFSTFRFHIDFSPAIPTGAEVNYVYRREHYNFWPFTLEELKDVISRGAVLHSLLAKLKMIGQELFITQPTEKATIKLVFPKGYQVTKFRGIAFFGKGEQIHREESERIKNFVCRKVDDFDDQTTLSLSVPEPQLYLTYWLLYEPPSINEIIEGNNV